MDKGARGTDRVRPHRLAPARQQRSAREGRATPARIEQRRAQLLRDASADRAEGASGTVRHASESPTSKPASGKEGSVVLVVIAEVVVCVPLTVGMIVDAPVAVLASLATGVGVALTAIASTWANRGSRS
jgi:hypothetical protein